MSQLMPHPTVLIKTDANYTYSCYGDPSADSPKETEGIWMVYREDADGNRTTPIAANGKKAGAGDYQFAINDVANLNYYTAF